MKSVGRFLCLSLLILSALASPAIPVPFRQAIELAVRHSNTMSDAVAEQIRARASYLEARNMYIPQAILGSGLAATFGFPLSIEGSAPSVFNVNVQSYLVNYAQRQFMRAARVQWQAMTYNTADRRQQAILDTALAYIQLDRTTTSLSLLRQQQSEAAKAEQVTLDRVRAGVDAEVEGTRARLTAARVRMRVAEAQGDAELLRTQLSQLTGLPANSIETMPESIPAFPAVRQEDPDPLPARAVADHPAVQLAESNALAKELQAKGEHKALYPAIDFVAQYGLFAKYNNYQEFFRSFQRNNGIIGVAIRFPFLNYAQRARAEAADAEAVKARTAAKAAREKLTNETLQLQRSVAQLAAARDVAKLEYELSQTDVDTAQARVASGQATIREEQNARLEQDAKYSSYLDTSFELEKAQMRLLRVTGGLEKWALQ